MLLISSFILTCLVSWVWHNILTSFKNTQLKQKNFGKWAILRLLDNLIEKALILILQLCWLSGLKKKKDWKCPGALTDSCTPVWGWDDFFCCCFYKLRRRKRWNLWESRNTNCINMYGQQLLKVLWVSAEFF